MAETSTAPSTKQRLYEQIAAETGLSASQVASALDNLAEIKKSTAEEEPTAPGSPKAEPVPFFGSHPRISWGTLPEPVTKNPLIPEFKSTDEAVAWGELAILSLETEKLAKGCQLLIREKIQLLLSAGSKVRFDNLEQRKYFATTVQRFLNLSETRIKCPKCGDPATFKCGVIGTQKEGAFQFVHTSPKPTIHGGSSSVPPNLELVSKKT